MRFDIVRLRGRAPPDDDVVLDDDSDDAVLDDDVRGDDFDDVR
ncbi:hypothetical protein [Bifidobacterium sp. AGR2158]|nr:hypothetical protein [Bifidobacterium sp. AGR2158]